jgi:carboxyl-terminal processing protease
VLDIDKRRAELLSLEKQTLDAENERRIATGQKPLPTGKAIRLH